MRRQKQRSVTAARPYYSAVAALDDTTAAGPPPPPPRRGLSVNTAIFAIATGFSRVAGLAREVVAASYFGTGGPASAFTIASQIPNLMSNLFAQAALSAAFVPVFTDLLQQGRKREAFKLASTLFWIILIALGALTAVGILGAGVIMPLFTGTTFNASLNHLTAGLAQVLFPVVLLLGLTGLLVGILQSYDEFSIPALAPAIWNLVILVLLVGLHTQYSGGDRLYAYAIAWLVATVVQLMMVASALRRIDFRLQLSVDWHDPASPAGVRTDAAGDDRPGHRQPRPAAEFRVRSAGLQRGTASDRQCLPDLHAPAGHLQRGRRHSAVSRPSVDRPHGATWRGCAARWGTGCARSTCC